MKTLKWRIQVIGALKLLLLILFLACLYFDNLLDVVGIFIFFGIIIEVLAFICVDTPIIKAERILDELSRGVNDTNDNSLELDKKIEKAFLWLRDTSSREYRMQMLRKEAELNELQNQINPHFLYNTLESIRGEALLEGADEIADMTEALGSFFRYSISRKRSIVTLEEEIKNVQNYFLIQKFRFGDRINMSVDIEDEAINKLLIPKLTVQPVVENAIFHGLETWIETGQINISIGKTDQRLVIVVSDDGKGMKEDVVLKLNERLDKGIDWERDESENSKRGIALDNVNQRIKLKFGEKYGLHIYSTLNLGTDVVITLPALEELKDGENADIE